MFNNTFEKQLEKTLKLGTQYSIECEKLKEKFCYEYDKVTIMALIELLISKGHPSEQTFASEFKKHYESDNYTDKEMSEFKKMFIKYKENIIDILESIEEKK